MVANEETCLLFFDRPRWQHAARNHYGRQDTSLGCEKAQSAIGCEEGASAISFREIATVALFNRARA